MHLVAAAESCHIQQLGQIHQDQQQAQEAQEGEEQRVLEQGEEQGVGLE